MTTIHCEHCGYAAEALTTASGFGEWIYEHSDWGSSETGLTCPRCGSDEVSIGEEPT